MAGPSPLGIIETQVGAIAYMFGILNNGTQIAITGIVSFELDSDDVTETWDERANKDVTGNTQNYTQTNFRKERATKFTPSGTTRAQAHAVFDAVMALQLLVVSNYKSASYNGTWRIKPGIKGSLKMDENGSISIDAEKFDNAAQNAALTGAPIVG